jgi:hypothetical protein
MLDLRECLFITFTYNHGTGTYTAHLPNGASFRVERQHVGGKLENALNLFKRQVIDLNSGRYIQSKNAKGELVYSYDETKVRKFKPNGDPALDLPDLELDLSDLEF